MIMSLPFALGGIFSGIRAGKTKLGLHRLDHAINATTELVIRLIIEKIMTETKKQARKKAHQELRS